MIQARHLSLSAVLGLVLGFSMPAWAVDEGTNIIGTDESPNALNLVPWQNRELGVDPWKDSAGFESQVLDDSLKPLDEDELRRQVEYFNLLRHSSPQVIEQ